MMKCFLPFCFTLCCCSLAFAQFRERPATAARRAARSATHVEGNLYKVLDFAVDGRVIAVSFSPKADYLAVATNTTLALYNEAGTRKTLIWDATKETPVPFEDRPLTNSVLAFSSDGKQLFFCGPQGLTVWNFAAGPSLDQTPVRAWTAPDVYNVAVADDARVVCAAKKSSSHLLQLRSASDGAIKWEKESGLLPITSMRSSGASVRCVVGNLSGSQCFWSDWDLTDGHQTLPIDLGQSNAFSVSQSPDGKTGAVASRAMSIINLETGEAKEALAPYHVGYHHWRDYYYEWPYGVSGWNFDSTVDSGWTTLFSPDGNFIVSIGKEAVFYEKSTGLIVGRIYFSADPFPLPGTTQAETDGVGSFSSDGQKFALVRQSRVFYSSTYNEAAQKSIVQRKTSGASGVEIYVLGDG